MLLSARKILIQQQQLFITNFQKMNTRQNIQKNLYALDQLETEMNNIKLINEYPPCISISGLRNLSLSQFVKNGDFVIIIKTLFTLLKIPPEWVLAIKNSPHTKIINGKLPFDAVVYIIDNQIKVKVYKVLLNHLKHTKQTKIHLKI